MVADLIKHERAEPCSEQLPQAKNRSLSSEESLQLQQKFPDLYLAAQSTLQPSEDSRTGDTLLESLVDSIQRMLTKADRRTLPMSSLEDESHVGEGSSISSGSRLHHVHALNPFNHFGASAVRPFLSLFLDRVNSVFYFFDEGELERYFTMVSEATSSLSNEKMSELCLVLALGAEMSNGGNDDKAIMWYENGRRYIDDKNWDNELWIMRATALISIYHIGERAGTSRYYLGQSSPRVDILRWLRWIGIALDIGRVNGLNKCNPLEHFEERERTKWLRVWNSVLFLHKCVRPSVCWRSCYCMH